MGTIPAPHVWTSGDDATSAVMQTLTDSNLYCLGSATSGGSKRPLCVARLSVAQSLASSTGNTALTLDAEDVDYDNGHSIVTNTSRFTALTAGWHDVELNVEFVANVTGNRGAAAMVNGAAITGRLQSIIPAAAASTVTVVSAAGKVYLNVNDYVEIGAFQNSGIALNVNTARLCVEWRSN